MDMIAKSQNEMVYLAWLAWAAMQSGDMLPLRRLLETFGEGTGVYEALRRGDPLLSETVPERFLLRMKKSCGRESFRKWEELIGAHGIHAMTFMDPEFPDVLGEIQDPASILFFQGDLSCLKRRKIAIFGSRAASLLGLKAARQIAEDLSRNGIAVVSGFAYGIDAAAHQGCLSGTSPTIAVMGCGLAQTYPSDHGTLRRNVLEKGGLLMTEYPPGEKPLGHHFPFRNRVISGLSDALALIEARIRSGSMTTVDKALQQGKELFVYPGDPMSPAFEGNRMLIRDGARFFTRAADILEDMNWLDNQDDQVQNSDCAGPKITDLGGNERKIAEALEPGKMSFDQLTSATGLAPSELMSALTILQVRQYIEALPGKIYQLKEQSDTENLLDSEESEHANCQAETDHRGVTGQGENHQPVPGKGVQGGSLPGPCMRSTQESAGDRSGS